MVFKAHALKPLDPKKVIIKSNGFSGDVWKDWIQLEVEEISILHRSSRYTLVSCGFCTDIKVGEVIKVSIETPIETKMVKKLGVAALYRDNKGSIQFVPITKVGLNTKKRKRN